MNDKEREQFNLLRSALVGIVGASDVDELQIMEKVLRAIPGPNPDRDASINAIRVLIETAEL